MNSKEKIKKAIHHQKPDRSPYDLGGTTVTAITKNAYKDTMEYKGFTTLKIDPISQIITPVEVNLVKLKSVTRRIGAQRIPEYHQRKRMAGKIETVTDFYGCNWELNPNKDLYFNQISFPLEKYDTLSEGAHTLYRTDWEDYVKILYRNLSIQVKATKGYCCVADRHTAGLTENSLRIREYEKWHMDTIMDTEVVEALLDIILEDKIRYLTVYRYIISKIC